ncbi:hypothetical protein J6590_028000 [Homalodisca vitripennis]|nr:hypothetical protein J6590_028000 [Homalodisca vitripennis]
MRLVDCGTSKTGKRHWRLDFETEPDLRPNFGTSASCLLNLVGQLRAPDLVGQLRAPDLVGHLLALGCRLGISGSGQLNLTGHLVYFTVSMDRGHGTAVGKRTGRRLADWTSAGYLQNLGERTACILRSDRVASLIRFGIATVARLAHWREGRLRDFCRKMGYGTSVGGLRHFNELTTFTAADCGVSTGVLPDVRRADGFGRVDSWDSTAGLRFGYLAFRSKDYGTSVDVLRDFGGCTAGLPTTGTRYWRLDFKTGFRDFDGQRQADCETLMASMRDFDGRSAGLRRAVCGT